MKDRLIFDTTDADTRAATDNVGAYLRASDGTLLTHTDVSGKKALDVRVAEGINVEVDLSHVDDSVKIGDGTDLMAVNADGSINAVVTATDLDIRDLTQADEITVFQGTDPWVIGDGGGSITVDGTVTVTDAANHAEDAAHASGDIGKFVLAVRQDANTPMAADGDYHPLVIDENGRLKVAAEVTVEAGDAEFLEDSAHTSGDAGLHMLAVRQDTLASSTSADGDYASLKVNAQGRLYVDVGTISTSDAALANTAIANAANPLGTADTAEAAVASALANRKYLWIYNNDNTRVFIGDSGVTAANGFPISPGSYLELRAGPAVSPYFVGQSGKTPEIRTLELS
jgi:hypothetical protein